jgi:dTDP-glucose pyrophosphorylase
MSHDWKNILLKPQQPIRDALQLIDKESLRIALVVDDNLRLHGIVTDGDIRRGLLRNLSIDSEVNKVMNINPLTAEYGSPRSELVKIMENEQILAIPLLKDGVIEGVETLQRSSNSLVYKNPVFLMAGGFGSRLKPLTDSCPKPMLQVGDKPILEVLLNSFIKSGFINFYISTHYMPEVIKKYFGDGSKWGVNINYVHEETPLGTGGALGLLPDDTPDLPLILTNGDVLTNVDFERILEFHEKNNSAATMCVRDYEYKVPYGVITGEGNRVSRMVEKPIQQFFVNAGIYVISSKVRKSVPKNIHVDMPSLLENYLDVEEGVMMFPIHEYWLDIGGMEDFKRAQLDIKNMRF